MRMEGCTFYIVRHGQAELNRDEIVMGQLDSPLTDLGRRQAERLRNEFHKIKFDAVLTSDLQRATETARIITGSDGSSFDVDINLRERNFGHLQGKPKGELEKFRQYTNLMTSQEQWENKLSNDIESDAEVFRRVHDCLKTKSMKYNGKTVLVVTHSGPIRTLLMGLGFFKPGTLVGPGTFGNGQYAVVNMHGKLASLVGIYPKLDTHTPTTSE